MCLYLHAHVSRSRKACSIATEQIQCELVIWHCDNLRSNVGKENGEQSQGFSNAEATVKLSPMHTFPKINICILFQTSYTSILPEVNYCWGILNHLLHGFGNIPYSINKLAFSGQTLHMVIWHFGQSFSY